jgi:hypothetical protein
VDETEFLAHAPRDVGPLLLFKIVKQLGITLEELEKSKQVPPERPGPELPDAVGHQLNCAK